MKVVTVINNETNWGFNLLKLSCALNGLELVVLVAKGKFSTNRIKDELLSDYLEEAEGDEIILFTDGNDAILMANEDEIISKFYATGRNLVFSAEVRCWPDEGLAKLYPPIDTTPYKYLNSGGFIGKAGLIKALIDDKTFDTDDFKGSNQYIWAKKYFNNTNKIALDTRCEIFCTFSPQIGNVYSIEDEDNHFRYMTEWFKSNFVIENGRIFNKLTKTKACQAHFNGSSKLLLYNNTNIVYDKIPGNKHPQFFYES